MRLRAARAPLWAFPVDWQERQEGKAVAHFGRYYVVGSLLAKSLNSVTDSHPVPEDRSLNHTCWSLALWPII